MRYLGLAENEIGASRLQSLSRAHDLLRVPVLDLSRNDLGAAGLQVILARPPGPAEPGEVRLQELNLSHNEFGDAGARILARCPHLGGLRTLRLVGCGIGDDGARALAESLNLNSLVLLDLNNNPIGDPGFDAFLSHNLRSLQELIYPRTALSRRRSDRLGQFRRGPG